MPLMHSARILGKGTYSSQQVSVCNARQTESQVIGDTWQAWPQLQLKALKRMHAFAREEKASEKQIPALPQPATPTSGRLGKKLSRSFSTSSAQTVSSWQSAFDDLAKAPGTRLLPLIKVPHRLSAALRVCQWKDTWFSIFVLLASVPCPIDVRFL